MESSVRLLYIKGIDRTNTPQFVDANQQRSYFYNKVVVSMQDSYFPPYFTNTLRVTSQDININSTKVNYVMLETFVNANSMLYYYFIDNITYINQDIYDLHLTMDVIQTYYFYLEFNSFTIERESINRWIDETPSKINRDYIRENLSGGNFNIVECDEPFEKADFGLYVVKASKDLANNSQMSSEPLDYYNTNGEKISDSFYYYLIPAISKEYYDLISSSNFVYQIMNDIGVSIHSTSNPLEPNDILKEAIKNPYVLDIKYMCPQLVATMFKTKVVYDTYQGSNTLYVCIGPRTSTDTSLRGNAEFYFSAYDGSNECAWFNIYKLYDKAFTSLFGFDTGYSQFVMNTNVNAGFSVRYCPQLIDENYLYYEFGENFCYTSFPMHQLLEPKIYGSLKYDIVSGSRVIKLSDDTIADKDKFLTTKFSNTVENVEMINDVYERYLATNKGTLTTGLALARQNANFNLAKSYLNIGGKAYQDITKNFGLGSITGTGSVAIDYYQTKYNITENLKVDKENAEFAPDSISQGNNYACDRIGYVNNITYRLHRVDDFEYVARQLEWNGYKVNRKERNFNPLTVYMRWYYSVLQCSDMSITPTTFIPNAIIEVIKERFSNGLRLWDITHTVANSNYGDCKMPADYDNVETDFI